MTEVISIKFDGRGKSYFFDPKNLKVKAGDTLIVETTNGLDIGRCSVGNHYVSSSSIVSPLRPVIRIANEDDLRIAKMNKEKEKEAFAICKEKIAHHQLDMKLVSVDCSFEGNKILFFFTADGRVDFRELVKDLASFFRARIELRQIGVRDETKMLGGLGICGRPYCCSQFLNDFQPVSTKMAKTQSMSLNPTKISGSCGRLMCCLRYEQDAYEDLIKGIPKNGAFVQTSSGYGNVVQSDVLRQRVKVRIDGEGDQEIKTLDVADVAVIPGGRPKPGDPMPQVLVLRENPKKAQEDDSWEAPELFAGNVSESGEGSKAATAAPVRAPKNEGGKCQRSRQKPKPGVAMPSKPVVLGGAIKPHTKPAAEHQARGKTEGTKAAGGKAAYEKRSGHSRSRHRHKKKN